MYFSIRCFSEIFISFKNYKTTLTIIKNLNTVM